MEIYFDNAATTRPDARVLERLRTILEEDWANPASGHRPGQRALRHLQQARRELAAIFDRRPSDVVFTSGATEANNLALQGVLRRAEPGRRLLISAIEHPAVAEVADALAAEGVARSARIAVDDEGRLDLEDLGRQLSAGDVALVSVMAVSNETGVVQDIAAVSSAVHAAGALLHVDAVQAVGKIPLESLHDADLLSISGHKIHGLSATGALLLRRRVDLQPLLHGGGQQRGRRAGTESAALASSLALAVELAVDAQPEAARRMEALRDRLVIALESVKGLLISSRGATRAPHIVHLTLEGIEAEPLQIRLDRAGIATSVGSACSTGALEPSPALKAMGVADNRLHGALRLSLSRESRAEEVESFLPIFVAELEELRRSLR